MVSSVAEALVTLAIVPLNRTSFSDAVALKETPVMVTVVSLGCPSPGVNDEMTSAGAGVSDSLFLQERRTRAHTRRYNRFFAIVAIRL